MITAEQLAALSDTLGDKHHTTAAVTTTAADCLPATPEKLRHKLTITNAGDETAFLALGYNAVVNAGFCLLPGATFTLDKGDLFNGRVSAITSANTTTLAIFAAYKGTP